MLLNVIGLGFALINGTNDGATLVATSLKAPGIRPALAIGILAAALGLVPALFGLRVAGTIAGGLVPAGPGQQRELMVLAVVAALGVVVLLNAKGLPTSLTLALVGGLVGAGLGRGLDVAWPVVGVTAAVGVAAPVLGALLGRALSASPLLLRDRWATRRLRGGHWVSFTLQAIAYASNDGQKIYAVLAAGALAAAAGPSVPIWQLVVVPALFAIGAVVTMRRAARTLGAGGILRTRPRDEVAAELSAATAVLGSAAVGIPVSMTQAVAASLIGAGMTRGTRQVRWRAAARLALAWALTLPSSAIVGAGIAGAGELIR